jgi:hypothetical protein
MASRCKQGTAVSFDTVLAGELDEIRTARQRRGVAQRVPDGQNSIARARGAELLGLGLSGGGIRSATFNLGVLQGLAEHKMLPQIDYLSTVSGGGYIGAWLLSLLKAHDSPEQVQRVEETLSDEHAHQPEAADQRPIHFLRQYSNYLTPRFSAVSADVWTMGVCWLRNTFLNLLLLVSSIGAVLTAARLVCLIPLCPRWDPRVAIVSLSAGVLSLCCHLYRRRAGQLQVQLLIVIPVLLGSWFLARWIGGMPKVFVCAGIWGYFLPSPLFALVALSGGFVPSFKEEHEMKRRSVVLAAIVFLVATLIPSFVTWVLIRLAAVLAMSAQCTESFKWALITWGPPAITALLALGVVFQIGMLGRDFGQDSREWFARLRAWTMIYSLGWILFFAASVYSPLWVAELWNSHFWVSLGLTGAWVTTTIAGVLGGKSAAASGKPGTPGTGAGGGDPKIELITRVAPFVFMAGFILAIACGVHYLLSLDHKTNEPAPGPGNQNAAAVLKPDVRVSGMPPTVTFTVVVRNETQAAGSLDKMIRSYWQLLAAEEFLRADSFRRFLTSTGGLFLLFTAVVVLLSFRLDINVFSLHEFYKNRLVRCYLGAARTDTDPDHRREPDPFTGFDEKDDRPLTDFNARNGGHYYGPFPILNATMNISSGQDLAWQQRKSAPWIFTPLYSGYNTGSGNEAMRLGCAWRQNNGKLEDEGYRRTADLCCPGGLRLGTAVAVSGAAASPNQGYHTATPVAFLMTVFDVRLGWWIGNPRRKSTFYRRTPRFNLLVLLAELFGATTADAHYVNLSDGGHFDNMGLYELIRRRCRYIIISDAEQDANLTCASLTRTIRNCRTDFGVEIDLSLDRIAKNDKGFSGTHCVVGTIAYPEDKNPGYLLYLKSSLTGDESADVLGYHTGHSQFPHQSTGDQWFTEAQFESYRQLGYHVIDTALRGIRQEPSARAEFFQALQAKWYPPSTRVDQYTGKHAELFTDLTSPVGEHDRLSFLDTQIFTDWNSDDEAHATQGWERRAIYRASLLIGFMNNVYSELRLSSTHERNHPHNQGWIRIFCHWTHQDVFRDTWKRTGRMYGEEFRQFYEDLAERDHIGE